MTGIKGQNTSPMSPAGLLPVALPLLLAALFWVFVLGGSGTGMSVWAMTRLNVPPVSGMPTSLYPWTVVYAAQMVLMWWVMMLAMMFLPLGVYGGRTLKQATLADCVFFLSGYSIIWLLFALVAAGLQWELERTGLFHPFMMWSLSPYLSAALLTVAGIYQLSALKSRSRSACRISEISLVSGIRFGKNCLLSTTPMMLVLFAGGAMNMVWMAVLTLVVLTERGLSDQRMFDRALASFFITLGVWSLWA